MTQQPQSGCMFLVLYEYNTNSRSKKNDYGLDVQADPPLEGPDFLLRR